MPKRPIEGVSPAETLWGGAVAVAASLLVAVALLLPGAGRAAAEASRDIDDAGGGTEQHVAAEASSAGEAPRVPEGTAAQPASYEAALTEGSRDAKDALEEPASADTDEAAAPSGARKGAEGEEHDAEALAPASGSADPADAPGSADPAGAPGSADPADAPGSADPAGAPGSADPADAPGSADPADAPGSADPADAPGSADPADAPGSAVPADAPGSAVPADAPGSAVPADAPGSSGSAEAPAPPALEPGPPAPKALPDAQQAPRTESTERASTPPSTPKAERPAVVIQTIFGLVALLALAYLGGHPKVRLLERRLRISQVVTAGFPFIAVGVVASLPSIGFLNESVLDQLTPVLRFGLGWIGFSAGLRFDTRAFDDLPNGTAAAVGFAAGIPFFTIVTAAGLLLLGASDWNDVSFRDPIFLRDALILGTAGAMTARAATRLVDGTTEGLRSVRRLSKIIQLEQLAGIAGLAFVAAFFRPHGPGIGWQLPGTAWLFLTVGLGASIGIVAYVILRRPATSAESVVLLLGTVAFAAGLASALHLSPIVVCFVAGVLLTNFPGTSKDRLRGALEGLERPIYLLFLVMVGALLEIHDWRGWVLLVVFVAARLLGKWLAAVATSRYTNLDVLPGERWIATRGPIGQLAIAIVVSAKLLFPHGAVPLIATAVIGGAIVTEILAQAFARGSSKGGTPTSTPSGNNVKEITPPEREGGESRDAFLGRSSGDPGMEGA